MQNSNIDQPPSDTLIRLKRIILDKTVHNKLIIPTVFYTCYQTLNANIIGTGCRVYPLADQYKLKLAQYKLDQYELNQYKLAYILLTPIYGMTDFINKKDKNLVSAVIGYMIIDRHKPVILGCFTNTPYSTTKETQAQKIAIEMISKQPTSLVKEQYLTGNIDLDQCGKAQRAYIKEVIDMSIHKRPVPKKI